jgi:WD40 repeat protein
LFKGDNFAFNVAISPNGSMVASADAMGELTLWDVVTRTKLSALQAAGQSLFGLAFSPSGRRIITGDRAGFIDIWDITTRRRMGRFHTTDVPSRLGISSGGCMLLADGRDGLHVWHAPSFEEIAAAERKQAARTVFSE